MRAAIENALVKKLKQPNVNLQMTHNFPGEAVAYYLGNSAPKDFAHLVVTEDPETARNFTESLKFWQPKKAVYSLPDYNPNLFSGVNLSPQQIHQRLQWLYHALNGTNDCVFVAPIMGLMQKTLPSDIFFDHFLEFSVGDELPSDIFNLLHQMGYASSPMVEDRGTFAKRGGLLDIFSPQMSHPVRIELFGDEIESVREFDAITQRTLEAVEHLRLIPAREALLSETGRVAAHSAFLKHRESDLQIIADHLRRNEYCENLEYYLPLFYQKLENPGAYFSKPPLLWVLGELNVETAAQKMLDEMNQSYKPDQHPVSPEQICTSYLSVREQFPRSATMNKVQIIESAEEAMDSLLQFSSKKINPPKIKKFDQQIQSFLKLIAENIKHHKIIVAVRGEQQVTRLTPYLQESQIPFHYLDGETIDWNEVLFSSHDNRVLFVERKFSQSFHVPSDEFLIISYEQFFGRSIQRKTRKQSNDRGKHLSFGEIREGDYVVHAIHGVCQFTGLQTMDVGGVQSEFLSLSFKDKDKLFLPIYRIHQIYKYSSERVEPTLDKLGGSKWENVKTKTKKRLREIANDLIQLYAQRKAAKRPAYDVHAKDVFDFFNSFPYEETEDQMAAIEDIIKDLSETKPMDRLICGDVGFGKTEVAMRAAFVVASQGKQVAFLAPTTVLTMQHFRTFKNRFADWPLRIEVINRLVPSAKVREILRDLKKGEVDIIIGTHRLLSKDVEFAKLGLLVCDEEQKFGVTHKERIRKMKVNVDTLTLSATPIPRTLNMGLLGIRDLSTINTAPVDRLETRTFICKYNEDIIRRAVETEIKRGGQVFFLHNRVQSIYTLAEELRRLLPKVRIGIGHGQLKEKELESVMVSFFNNDLDLLLSTTIIESGMDIPNANTILINHSENFGLSQLYQLRGRVGRSGRRAYCYLLTNNHKQLSEIAKERLKVIQENTALGSGMQIAHYDMELRGAGTLLGEEQSGIIDSVGYEFYMELLDESLKEVKGEAPQETTEPDINLKIKAFIPHTYIPNIRMRLSYYRALTQIQSENDIDDLEEELKDQFGKPPEEVINLLGIMLIRRICLQLGVRDISSGKESLILSFTENTPLPPEKAIELTTMANKKYSITPDNRLKIRLKDLSWPKVYDEVSLLLKYCPSSLS